ncbi:MAG: hypothetical protein IJ298_02280 [Ruminococcus sp.]|nr:hypothetical protein [Ruminococcus sp.]
MRYRSLTESVSSRSNKTVFNTLVIFYTSTNWWLRSPNVGNSTNFWNVNNNGNCNNNNASNSNGVCP